MKSIQSNVIITSFTSKADGSLSMRVSTPKLTNEEKVVFMEYQNVNALMQLKPLDAKETANVAISNKIDGKSPSQRLRAVLFVLWKQHNTDQDFESYYTQSMERIIESIKNRIDG